MNDQELKKRASKYINLTRAIARANTRLKKLKKEICDEVKTRKTEHTKAVSGGWSWTIVAKPDGSLLRVTRAGRTLRSSFAEDSDDLEEIREVSGSRFSQLFTEVISFEPVDDFRDEAFDLLGKDEARQLLALCTKAGALSVSSETKASTEDEED